MFDWPAFRGRFVTPDGRVVDTGNGGISHSEGQGWGLLFAVAADDRRSFERILDWTSRTLRRPRDSLHAWRYEPGREAPVSDLNNATDGDIFIAAALQRAANHWNEPRYARQARAIADDIGRLLVRAVGQRVILLPGITGFERTDDVTVNPSYYAIPFITELAPLSQPQLWKSVLRDGAELVQQGRFGRWKLPPDWLRVRRDSDALDPAPGWPPRYSFDAVRVPLWFAWGRARSSELQRALERYWSAFPPGQVPAWVDLISNETAPYPATPGMVAVARLAFGVAGAARPEFPAITPTTTYYDAALILLSQMAWQDLRLR